MEIFVVNCGFNVSRVLTDCAFKDQAAAKAYADALNGDKASAAARCRELIALREGKDMVKFLAGEEGIAFEITAVELKI